MRQYAAAVLGAGFKGERAAEAVAVGWAESRGDVGARNSSSGTRGPWQFHPFWHREVSDACAFDLNCAAKAAFRVSNHGADWSQWSTWPDAAAAFLPEARKAVGAPAKTVPASAGGATGGPGGTPLTNMPGWLWFLGKAELQTETGQAATDAAMQLVKSAAPVMLTVAAVGGAMALIAVGLSQSTKKPTDKGGDGAGT